MFYVSFQFRLYHLRCTHRCYKEHLCCNFISLSALWRRWFFFAVAYLKIYFRFLSFFVGKKAKTCIKRQDNPLRTEKLLLTKMHFGSMIWMRDIGMLNWKQIEFLAPFFTFVRAIGICHTIDIKRLNFVNVHIKTIEVIMTAFCSLPFADELL